MVHKLIARLNFFNSDKRLAKLSSTNRNYRLDHSNANMTKGEVNSGESFNGHTVVPGEQPPAGQRDQLAVTDEKNPKLMTAAAPVPPDVISQVLGDFGVWQLRTVLILFLSKIPAAWFMACIIFTAPALEPETEYVCRMASNQTVSADQCYVQATTGPGMNASIAEEAECPRFEYNSNFQSLLMQFDLLCGRDILLAWTQYWHLFGVLSGGVVATKLMLRFGISPRNVYILGMVLQIVCGCLTGYSGDFSMHCAFRCLSAVCCALMFTAGQAIFVDITGGKHRIGCVILFDTFWSIGVILLPGLSWFFNSWKHIYLGITFPTVLLFLLMIWTPDSPRWLLKYGQPQDVDKVEAIVRRAAEINLCTNRIPENLRTQLETLRESMQDMPRPSSWLQLWQGPKAKGHMIFMHVALAVFIINFMGMLLNIRSFGREYLVTNTIIMGFAEIVGTFLAFHITLQHNRWKWQWAGALNVIGGIVGCLGWIFTDWTFADERIKVTLWMVIAVIPKLSVSCAQSMILACMAEFMPANKKGPYTFSVVTWARIWLLCAPFINVLKRFDVALSLSAYSGLNIVGGLCLCFLLTPAISTVPTPFHQPAPAEGKFCAKEESPLAAVIWTIEEEKTSNNST